MGGGFLFWRIHKSRKEIWANVYRELTLLIPSLKIKKLGIRGMYIVFMKEMENFFKGWLHGSIIASAFRYPLNQIYKQP